MRAMKKIVRCSGDIGIEHLTVYAFSTENWRRPKAEVSALFNILVYFADKELAEIKENNVRVKILGDYSSLPKKAIGRLDKTVEETKDNTGLGFNIAINYGGRDEIVRAANEAYIAWGEVTEDTLDMNLWTAGIPDPELVIRTSGEKRLSNFLLWQAAYSEFIYRDTLWPDFDEAEYMGCIEEYQKRKRNFGGR
jgi:undecaprenyl diphosphate synthase